MDAMEEKMICSEVYRRSVGNIFEDNRINLHYRSHVRVKNKIYFSEAFFNGLFEMDLEDFSVKFICHFSGEDKFQIVLHGENAVLYKNIIYFFPLCTNRIHYYNLVDGEEQSMIVPTPSGEVFDVTGVVQKESKIWLFSGTSKGVFVLDMENRNIKRARTLSERLSKYKNLVGFVGIPEEGKAFTYCPTDSTLLEISLEKEQIKEHKVQIGSIKVCSINYNREMFYFIDAVSGDLYEWSWDAGQLRKYSVCGLERLMSEGASFSSCCFVDDDIYMIPRMSRYVMRVNKENGTIERAFDYPEDFQFLDSWRKDYIPGVMLLCEKIDHELWFHPYGSNQLLIYDTISKQVSMKKITIEADNIFSCEALTVENVWMSLAHFCHNIEKEDQSNIVEDEACGRKIYLAINE